MNSGKDRSELESVVFVSEMARVCVSRETSHLPYRLQGNNTSDAVFLHDHDFAFQFDCLPQVDIVLLS